MSSRFLPDAAALRGAWVVALALAAGAYALAAFDWRAVGAALARLDPLPLLAVTVLSTLAVFLACAVRWVAVNQLPWRAGVLLHVYAYVAVVIGVAIATPMQLGEVLKVKFARDSGLPLGSAAVNLALERVIDLAAIAAMAAAGLVRAATGSAALAAAALAAILGLGLAAPSAVQWAVRRWAGTRLGARLAGVVGAPLPPARLLVVAASTVVKWGLTVVAWVLLLRLAGVPLRLDQGMVLVGGVTALSIVSMVPGGIGVQEVSARTILVAFGAEPAAADAGAVVLRLFTPVMVGLGLAHLPLLRGTTMGTSGVERDG